MEIKHSKVFITTVGFSDDKMFIELNIKRILTVPYTYTKKLASATIEDLKDYWLIANGVGIHFEN